MTALAGLPQADVNVASASSTRGDEGLTRVTVENPGRTLAFFVHLKVKRDKDGEEILPVLWQDNYFPLLPGEKREINAAYRLSDLANANPVVEVDGWNVKRR
jgi:exo-1,4-beta-D-glucosaminidase